nr:biotin/lipoyl-binding protein [Helicobacter anatolicus]
MKEEKKLSLEKNPKEKKQKKQKGQKEKTKEKKNKIQTEEKKSKKEQTKNETYTQITTQKNTIKQKKDFKKIQNTLLEKIKNFKNKKVVEKIILIVILFFIILWLGITFYRAYETKPQYLQGQITAKEYSVSSKLAGRVENLKVKKGDFVNKGDLIYQINSPEVNAKLTQAQAGYEAAKALSEETKKGSREETIISAKDVWSSAKAMTELTQKTYDRIAELYKSGVVSLQKRDEAYAAYQSAKYNENVAYQQYKIALDGARDETKKAAFEKQKAAEGQVSEVEAYLKDINAYAPISGEVSNVLLHDGELSPSGFPVVLLIDTKDIWLRFSVNEQYLPKFQKDSVFEGYIPALDRTIQFKVRYISVMGDFATWKATANGKGYDMKSYEIEAVPLEEIEEWRVGMSVLIKVF